MQTHKCVCTHSYSTLTLMYGHIRSHIHTHRQKYTCTGTGRAETPSLSSGFSIPCTKPEVHLLSKWHHKLAFALSSCQSPSSFWKVVPIINKICPTPGHTPFLPTHRKKKNVIPKKGFVIPCLMPGIISISTDNLGGREHEASAPQTRSTFFYPKGSPHSHISKTF